MESINVIHDAVATCARVYFSQQEILAEDDGYNYVITSSGCYVANAFKDAQVEVYKSRVKSLKSHLMNFF